MPFIRERKFTIHFQTKKFNEEKLYVTYFCKPFQSAYQQVESEDIDFKYK